MKQYLLATMVFFTVASCSSPGPLTANPDDATSSPGTVGSSKMTEQMPRKPVRDSRPFSDTATQKRDSLPTLP